MSRKIKFRVWDKLEKRFDSNYHLTMDLNGRVYNLKNGAGGSDYEVQQFTGLLDKNGVEIYDGDILEFFDKENSDEKLTTKVYFHSVRACWTIYPFAIKCGGIDLPGNLKYLQVIGNIYSNPELLK